MHPDHWQRIQSLYEAAVAQPPTRRNAFLSAACAGDDTLRREVEALLVKRQSDGEVTAPPALAASATQRRPSFVPGARIGTYELGGVLGVGGMGEVYRARDTRLGRVVAIKLLPREFSTDQDRLARFEREARILAALSHPNVGTIYGIEDHLNASETPVRALILELVEGETLAERIDRGALTLAEATAIGRQIAEALDAAHEQGIVHRDLKPANIKVTPNHVVKVLDFGLAKLAPIAHNGTSAAELATATGDHTRDGVILGTVAYMSPEQVRGRPVDKRTDIWAFGCILYEMLTGRHPFARETLSDTIAAILDAEPDWTRVSTAVPPQIVRLLHRTLEKETTLRLRDIGDARAELDVSVSDSSSLQRDEQSRVLTRWAWGMRALAVAVALGGSAAIAWLLFERSHQTRADVTRLSIMLPANQLLNSDAGAAPLAISPDGRTVVYAADSDSRTQLYVRALDAFESRPLAGTEGARYPFFSPDGQSVAFFANRKLLRAALRGGAPVPVCDVPSVGHGGTWGPDGTIVFDPGPLGLMRVSADGGRPELLASRDSATDRQDFHWPQFLPDGRSMIATVGPGLVADGQTTIAVFSFTDRQWHTLFAGKQAQYAPPGYLVYHADHIREGEIQVVPFDTRTLSVHGKPTSPLDDVFRARNGGAAYFAVAPSGTLVFAPGGFTRTLVRVDRNGRRFALSNERRGFRFPRISPDGRHVAVTIDPRPSVVWVYDIERQSRIPLANVGHSLVPVWNPNGSVTYSSANDLYWQAADGSSAAERLLERAGSQFASSWSPDGRFLLFQDESHAGNGGDIWMLPRGGEAKSLIATPANELGAVVSPDGHWLAYQSDESGRAEIYVRPFPDVKGRKSLVSVDGGHSPRWSHDGRELYFMNGPNLIAAPVTVQRGVLGTSTTPSILFSGPFDTTQDNNYDVMPDGSGFIMVEGAPTSTLRALQVVLHWAEDIQRSVSSRPQ